MILEEADLELALTPPTDGSNIKATVVRLTPEDNILSLRNFQRHRRNRRSAGLPCGNGRRRATILQI